MLGKSHISPPPLILEHQLSLDLNDPRRERRAKRVRRASNNWFESCGAKRNATHYIVSLQTLAD